MSIRAQRLFFSLKNVHYTKKSQKLLDRLLFIFFSEDKNLLPTNSIDLILKQWKTLKELDEYQPLYNRLKKYFGYMNSGHKNKSGVTTVFAYNGGLFKEDEILDNVIIDDKILEKHLPILAAYDFDSEVDVNILGHIFENSLNEIEEVSEEITTGVKQVSKRKKDGVFYTPKYITTYIVENTIGKLCAEKKAEIDKGHAPLSKKKELLVGWQNYRNWLLSLTICDPACGSGAFLNAALDFLMNEHKLIDEMTAKLTGASIIFSEVENSILENNLFGVDINDESVEIAKLSLWLRTAKPHRKLNSLNNNIKCGNSLISPDIQQGGNSARGHAPLSITDKAFDWQAEFPQVFAKKKKKAFHITTATHNSRYSQRMFDAHVKLGEAVWLSEKEEQTVTETIAEIIEKDKLNVLAFNICGDHFHLLLVCEEAEVVKIVGKIKSMSARACNIVMGRTIASAGMSNSAACPTIAVRGETQFSLWTKKFGCNEMRNDEQLTNTIFYIENNRKKHGLDNGGACPTVYSKRGDLLTAGHAPLPSNQHAPLSIPTVTIRHAFRTEYSGGFDVVIGNPPYVRKTQLPQFLKDKLEKDYFSAIKQYDLYVLFNELAIRICKKQGFIGFIQPNKFMSADYGVNIVNYLKNNVIIKAIKDVSLDKVFSEASVYPYIFIFQKISNQIDFKIENISLFDYSEKLEGFENQSNSKSIIDKLQSNSIKLEKITSFIKRGVPNTKIDFTENGNFTGIKSVDLSYPFSMPKLKNNINYLSSKDEIEKIKEFSNELILLPRTILKIRAILGNQEYHILDRIYYFGICDDNFNKKFILSILNSSITTYYYEIVYGATKIGGGYIDLKGSQIENFPIPNIPISAQQPFIELADKMLELNKTLQSKKQKFFNRLADNFSAQGHAPVLRITGNLEKFNEMEFGNSARGHAPLSNTTSFVAELKKQKFALSLKQQDEWEEYFTDYKTECNQISNEIKTTDNEIDRLVYGLYGLSEEEIKIVECRM